VDPNKHLKKKKRKEKMKKLKKKFFKKRNEKGKIPQKEGSIHILIEEEH